MNQNRKGSFLLNRNIIDIIILLIISVAMMVYSLKNHYKLPQLQWVLSPYLFPFLISIFVLLLAVALMFESLKQKKIAGSNGGDGIRYKNVIVVVMLSILYLIALKRVGFIISSILFLIALFLYLGEKRIRLILLISVVTIIIIYVIFGMLLHVMLP